MHSPARDKHSIECVRTANGQVLTKASAGTSADVDRAVKAAREAFNTTWGLNCPGPRRGQLLQDLASLVEKHQDELAALETLDVGEYSYGFLCMMFGVTIWRR